MGSCLAYKFVKFGHKVSIANSRGPASLIQVSLDTGAEAVTAEEAVKNKDVVILSIPSKNIPDLPNELFKSISGDTAVVDTTNYYPTLRDGVLPALEQTGIDSLWVQQTINVPVIKAFNAILATSVQNVSKPKGTLNRLAIAVSGPNGAAMEKVFKLIDDLGFDPAYLGPIDQSWKQQPGSPIYCRDIGWAELKRRADNMGADWSEMCDFILAKRKAAEAIMGSDYPAYLKSLQE